MTKLNRTIIKEEIEKLNNLQIKVEEFLSADKYIFDEELENFKNLNRYKLLKLGFTLDIFLYFDYRKYKKVYYETKNKLKKLIKKKFILFQKNSKKKMTNLKLQFFLQIFLLILHQIAWTKSYIKY